MHYTKIAIQGYSYPLQAFFPLYPLVIWVAHLVLPLNAAFRINILLGIPMLFILDRLLQRVNISEKSRLNALVMFLAFPSAFFLQANYSETLFIIISGLALVFLLAKENTKVAQLKSALVGILLTLVKVSGVAIVPVILYSLIRSNKKQVIRAAALSAIPLIGIFSYFLYLNLTFGSYSLFFKAQAEWGRSIFQTGGFFLTNLIYYLMPIGYAIAVLDVSLYRRFSELLALLLVVTLLVLCRKKMPTELWLFSLFQLAIPVLTGSLLSFNRLVLLSYPVLLVGATLVKPKTQTIYLISAIPLQLLGIYFFMNGVFVG
jgi:hypothetical protein